MCTCIQSGIPLLLQADNIGYKAPPANNTAAMLYWKFFNLFAVTSRHESLLRVDVQTPTTLTVLPKPLQFKSKFITCFQKCLRSESLRWFLWGNKILYLPQDYFFYFFFSFFFLPLLLLCCKIVNVLQKLHFSAFTVGGPSGIENPPAQTMTISPQYRTLPCADKCFPQTSCRRNSCMTLG